MRSKTAALICLIALALLAGVVAAHPYQDPAIPTQGLWYLDWNGDGLVDDMNGDMKSTLSDVALLYYNAHWIAQSTPEVLPMFDYNRDGVTNMADLEYAYNYVRHGSGAPAPKPQISVSGYTQNGTWYPHGMEFERADYEKTPSITLGWDPAKAPKINRPSPSSSFMPLPKRFGT